MTVLSGLYNAPRARHLFASHFVLVGEEFVFFHSDPSPFRS